MPCRIFVAWPHAVVGTANDLAQFLKHEVGDRGVFAPFDRALELPHQQRLRLRRELREVILQPFDRCLVHARKS